MYPSQWGEVSKVSYRLWRITSQPNTLCSDSVYWRRVWLLRVRQLLLLCQRLHHSDSRTTRSILQKDIPWWVVSCVSQCIALFQDSPFSSWLLLVTSQSYSAPSSLTPTSSHPQLDTLTLSMITTQLWRYSTLRSCSHEQPFTDLAMPLGASRWLLCFRSLSRWHASSHPVNRLVPFA